MTDEFDVAQNEATDEVETETQAVAVEDNGQDNPQPPEGDESEATAPAEEPEGEKSESQKRRERRKANMQRLKDEAAAALGTVDRIKEAAKGETEPTREEFEDPDDYVAAKAAYMGSQAFVQREQRAAEAQAQAATRQLSAEQQVAWREQQADARTRHADYDAVVNNPTLVLSSSVAQLVTQSDVAGDLAYHVASNPAKAAELSSMTPMDAAREIGRMEAMLTPPQPKTKTAAPTPLKPVRGGGKPIADPSKMSMSEYRAWRQNSGG